MDTNNVADDKEKDDPDKKKTEFYCKICDKYYASYKSFGNHTRSYHSLNKEKAKCEFCGNCFTRKDNLQQHIRLFHTSEIQTLYKCTFCEQNFMSRNSLSRHKLECVKNNRMDNLAIKKEGTEVVKPQTIIVYGPSPVNCVHVGIGEKQINDCKKDLEPPVKKRGRKTRKPTNYIVNDDNNNNNDFDSNTTFGGRNNEEEYSEDSKALDCQVCNITFLSEKDYLSHKPFCDSADIQ
jgi:Zinc finger, C2H2 type.